MSTGVVTVARRRIGRRHAGTELPGTSRLFSRTFVAVLGVAMAALMVGAVIVIVDSFRGTFSSDVTLHAILPAGPTRRRSTARSSTATSPSARSPAPGTRSATVGCRSRSA